MNKCIDKLIKFLEVKKAYFEIVLKVYNEEGYIPNLTWKETQEIWEEILRETPEIYHYLLENVDSNPSLDPWREKAKELDPDKQCEDRLFALTGLINHLTVKNVTTSQ